MSTDEQYRECIFIQACSLRVDQSLLWSFSHSCPIRLSSSDILFRYPPPSCWSLSQPTGKGSCLSKGETVQLLNIISLLLSRMFHSPSSGKEDSTGKEDINLPLSGNGLRQCFLWELSPLPPPSLFSIGFSLLSHLHNLLWNNISPPPDLSCHRNFHLEPGTFFYILDPITGRVYYCLSPFNVHNNISRLQFWESLFHKDPVFPHWTQWDLFLF